MVKCLSNLRQLGMAFTMYNNENRLRYPGPAYGGNHEDDWVWWDSGRDPTQGAIQKYLISDDF